MAVYTVNTGAMQEAVLDATLITVNARRTAAGQSTITKAQLVQLAFNDKVDDFKAQVLAEQRAPIVPALDNATVSQINQIRAILGLP